MREGVLIKLGSPVLGNSRELPGRTTNLLVSRFPEPARLWNIVHDWSRVSGVKSLRCIEATLALVVLFLLANAPSLDESQNGFSLMDGEIRVRGVLVRKETNHPKWLLHLEKPIDVDGKEENVIEVIEPSPGPAMPLTNGSRYEFTGRLDVQRNRALLRVTTIRRLEDPTSANKLPQSKSAKP